MEVRQDLLEPSLTYFDQNCFCDFDPPTWITIRNVKAARKNHTCAECRAVIFKGEPYEYTSAKWEDSVDDYHICLLCVELREWAKISVPCFCWYYGNLHDDVQEMVREVSYTTPGMFMEYGRRMVKIRQIRKERDGG